MELINHQSLSTSHKDDFFVFLITFGLVLIANCFCVGMPEIKGLDNNGISDIDIYLQVSELDQLRTSLLNLKGDTLCKIDFVWGFFLYAKLQSRKALECR